MLAGSQVSVPQRFPVAEGFDSTISAGPDLLLQHCREGEFNPTVIICSCHLGRTRGALPREIKGLGTQGTSLRCVQPFAFWNGH